jgi:phospholipid transport system substrate-binding protein
MMRLVVCGYLLLLSGIASLSYAEQPLEALERGINQGIRILADPQYADPTRKALQYQKLWEVCRQIFNFEEFSRRVLGSGWKRFNPQQRDQFVTLFSEFLAQLYLRKLQQIYSDEKLIYERQEIIGDFTAVVTVTILWQNLEVPLEIRMTKHKGTWQAYDVGAFGISAVIFYRDQFAALLNRESPDQVIARLKNKIVELEADS